MPNGSNQYGFCYFDSKTKKFHGTLSQMNKNYNIIISQSFTYIFYFLSFLPKSFFFFFHLYISKRKIKYSFFFPNITLKFWCDCWFDFEFFISTMNPLNIRGMTNQTFYQCFYLNKLDLVMWWCAYCNNYISKRLCGNYLHIMWLSARLAIR